MKKIFDTVISIIFIIGSVYFIILSISCVLAVFHASTFKEVLINFVGTFLCAFASIMCALTSLSFYWHYKK